MKWFNNSEMSGEISEMGIETMAGKLPFNEKLTDAEKELLFRSTFKRNFEKNAGINAFSDACFGMIYVVSGSIRVYITSDEGREITLFHIDDGNCCILSASCVIENIGLDVQLMAEKDTEILAIHSGTVRRLMDENIEFRCFVYELSMKRLTSVISVINEILFEHFDVRLARTLIVLYEKNGKKDIKMTQESLAQEVNSAREVVARMLKAFAADGWIELGRGSIIIKDIEALRRLAER